MRERILYIAIIVLLAALLVSLFFNYKQYRDAREKPEVSVDTTVEWRETSSVCQHPSSEREVGSITVPVGMRRKKEAADSHRDTTAAIEPEDTVLNVTLPKVQKVYIDSTYTAYVSGYQPSLDSLRIRYPLTMTTVTKEKRRYDERKFSIGIVGGYGYGLSSRKVEPFIGIGVSVNLW